MSGDESCKVVKELVVEKWVWPGKLVIVLVVSGGGSWA
jgi:hypothetical protein